MCKGGRIESQNTFLHFGHRQPGFIKLFIFRYMFAEICLHAHIIYKYVICMQVGNQIFACTEIRIRFTYVPTLYKKLTRILQGNTVSGSRESTV